MASDSLKVVCASKTMGSTENDELRFPEGFMWGTATASYQIEGGWNEGGRGWSIWDSFSHTPGNVENGDTGDVACDHYHLYKEDVQRMKAMGLKYYRFSIAWPRIQPAGKGEANKAGLDFYNSLIDELLAAGVEPVVTLYHWDFPLELLTKHDGWLNRTDVPDYFAAYARLCFQHFGDRVKWWITLNEPWCSALLGYGTGEHAPGRTCAPAVEPYLAAHSLLLAHAKAVQVYKKEFQETQAGKIGITLNSDWFEPLPSNDPTSYDLNQDAAERGRLFHLGWFADPIYLGDYPKEMRDLVGERLPQFSAEEKAMLKGSSDFFGLNHYSSALASSAEESENSKAGSYRDDMRLHLSADPDWSRTDMGWSIVPWGLGKLLLWIQNRYSPKGGIICTENGCAVHEPTKEAAENDQARVDFYKGYISEMHKAMQEGADCRGYFAWSFMDNFEWAFGYSKRFGMHWVDFETLERHPKKSAAWFAEVARKNACPVPLEKTVTLKDIS
ncbi:hypothetical protein BSKO_10764 [Bryopsis sp. KO-2023]|nr:hypothetical protein BSKO_10764 [Bryopsis sp. KO-2023]